MSRRRRTIWRIASITEVIDRDPVARGLDARLVAIGYTRRIESTQHKPGPDHAKTVMVGYVMAGGPPVSICLALQPGDLVKAGS